MHRGGLFLLSLFLIAPALMGSDAVDATGDPEPCPGFTFVHGQGPSCPAEDGWWVLLENGDRLFTHGPDRAPDEGQEEPFVMQAADDNEPTCASIGTFRMVLVYTVPVDKPSRHEQMAEPIRDMVRTANAVLSREAAAFGHEIDYRIECDPLGTMTVYEVRLATPGAQDSFATITAQLQARGFDDPMAKYWVWHDNRISGIGGQGNAPRTESPTIMSDAARGPHYALTYGYDSWRIMMHENGHNMGAVQRWAPNTSGAGHCIDGWDVMCYADGGSESWRFSNSVCTDRIHFDCNQDDYFHPAPPPGNILHDHWNLAGHVNPFVEIPDRCSWTAGILVTQDALPSSVPGVTEHWVEDLPVSCGGRHFVLMSPSGGPIEAALEICWYAGEDSPACHGPSAPVKGTIPMGAERARITYTGSGVAPFVLNVN